MPRIARTKAIIAAFLLFAVAAPAGASEYPDHGIKLTVAWPAGASTDLVGRFVAEQLSVALKQPVVVENRAGANGNIGADMVAKLPADGYSLMIATAETHAINPHVYKKLGYHAARDFDPIALLARVGFVLVTRSGLPAKNVAEFVCARQGVNPARSRWAATASAARRILPWPP